MRRVHVYISGKVQGVFFRDSTRATAQRLGVHGWVRNLADGRVEAVFQGERKAIDDALAWCKRGPPTAHVEDIEVHDEAGSADLTRFEVRATAGRKT